MQWADMPVVPLIGDDPLPRPECEDAPLVPEEQPVEAAKIM